MRSSMLLVLSGLLAACSPAVEDDDATLGWGGKGDGSGSPIAPNSALVLDVRQRAADGTFTLRGRLRLLSHTGVENATVRFSSRLCDLWLDSSAVKFNPKLYAGLPAFAMEGALVDEDDQLRLEVPAAEPAALVLGAVLADPLHDALPTSAADERLRDPDADSSPGLSAQTSLGRVFAAVRVAFHFRGTLSRGALTSTAQVDQLDFSVLGDTIPFVDVKKRVTDKPPLGDDWREKYALDVRVLPMEGDDVGCAEVKALAL